MPSRRRLLRNAAALALGGFVASTPAAAQSSSQSPTYTRYDAGTVADAETVLTAACTPGFVSEVPLPAAVRGRLADLRGRYDALSLSDTRRLTGSVAVDGSTVEGCVTLAGSFDIDAAESELKADDTLRKRPDEGGLRRFDADDTPVSLALGDRRLRVGYGPDSSRASDHLQAAIDGQEPPETADHGALPALLDGDAAVYARLGDRSRQRAVAAIGDEAPPELKTVLSDAAAVGAAIRTAPDESRVRYGAVSSQDGVDAATARRLTASAGRQEDALSDTRLYRQGRTVIADAAVETPAVWNAHVRLLGREADAEASGLTTAEE